MSKFRRVVKAFPLCLALAGMVSGCAPLMRGAVAVSGGGTGGSSCEYEGLFRGSDCLTSVTHVYIADKEYGDKIPRVCGSLTTWGLFGSKHWQPGASCYKDVPSYCQSDVLVPGFDNATLAENNATTVSRLNKSTLCATPMTAQVVFSTVRRNEERQSRVWARLLGRDAMARKVDITVKGDEIDQYCESSVLFPTLDDKVLADYGLLKEAEMKKKRLCNDPKRYGS